MDSTASSPEVESPIGIGQWQHQYRHKMDVYDKVLQRLRDSSCPEAQSPTFEKELWAHFNCLPPKYSLNINMMDVDDIVTHMRLLKQARDPGNRPAFFVRVVEFPPVQVVDENKSDSSDADTKGEEEATSRRSAHPPPAFGSSTNLELLVRESSNLQIQDGNSVGSSIPEPSKDEDNVGSSSPSPSGPMHEINYSSSDKPLLLHQVSSLISDLGLNVKEAHAFNTNDGYLLDVFLVDGWSCEETEQLKVALREGFQRIEEHFQRVEKERSEPQPSSSVREIEEIEEVKDTIQPYRIQIPRDEMDLFEIDYSVLKLENKMSSGSFCDVYHGKCHNTEVAIKLLKPDQGNPASMEAEFVQEVNMLRMVRHKNVVQFIGACTRRPNFCIVTEFMKCGSVYDVLRQEGGFSLPTVLKVAIDVANGMNYLHEINIVHRDLKAANLLMDEHRVVKVADFGVARIKNRDMTRETGTYKWMAPEMLEHKHYDHKVDVYSFAIVLWELLTGKVPYESLTPLQAAIGVINGSLRPDIPASTPPNLSKLIWTCWKTDPAQRPEFSEILKTLHHIAKEVRGEPSSPIKKLSGFFSSAFGQGK